MKTRKRTSKSKNRSSSKLSMIYGRLCRESRLSFLLYYAKTSIIHIAFEAVLTVLYIAPLIIYPECFDPDQATPLSIFFGRVLLSCATIFTFIICTYSALLFVCCIFVVLFYKDSSFDFWKEVRRVSFVGIFLGFVLYIIGGFLVSRNPDVFAGMKTPYLLLQQENFIWVMIIVFGGFWAVLSFLRLFQFNKKADAALSASFDESVCCQSINRQSLFFSISSKVAQIVIICIVGVFLLSTMRLIPQTEESFNYYNLILVIYFAVFSTYATLCYKLEISHNFPGISICTNKTCPNRRLK